ncbi:MAG: sortase [Actinobacteria bacterium]|nr:sortase [Actinomycetota bacterium]
MTILRTFGKLLISLGVGVLLFVAYVIWGTNFYTGQAQNDLAEEFDRAPIAGSATKGRPPKNFTPGHGAAVFRILIPKIDLNDGKGYIVVEGVDEEALKLGPGHYPECRRDFPKPLCTNFPAAWPGEKGRVILSGHRTTYKAPFIDTDKLSKGDEIIVETKWGIFTYEVYQQKVVEPEDSAIVVQKDDVRELVLTTCNPKFSAAQRLITFARQVEAEAV